MSVRAGKLGSIKLATNAIADMSNWNLDATMAVESTTSFGDSWEEFVSTIGSWKVTADGFYNDDDTNGQAAAHTAFLAGTSVTIRLYVDAASYLSGTVFITNIKTTNDAKGVTKISYELTGSGSLSYTAAAAA